MKKTLQISNGIALVVTVVINYLSNTGVFNGETMATISAKYQNLFTPAGYAFSIWGLIYLGLLGFVIYFGPFTKQSKDKEKVLLKIGWWFVVSCVANSLWVITWLYQYTFCTILLMLLLFVSVCKIVEVTKEDVVKSIFKTRLFLKLPFQIYSGWISVALIANVAAYLKKIEWDGFGISETSWTVFMFAVALSIHLVMIWNRNMPAFAMVAVWALIAIAIANKSFNDTVYISSLVTAIMICINVVAWLFQSRRHSRHAVIR